MDDIQTLNPEFRRWTTPVKKGEYTIRVPLGTADKVREGLAAAAPGPTERDAMAHREARRDARHDRQEAAREPHGSRRSELSQDYIEGRWPVRDWSFRACRRRRFSRAPLPASSRQTAAAIVADVLAETTEETKAPVAQAPPRTYRVRSGDTLSAIARKTGTTIAQLKNWNKLRTTNLKVGTRLLIQSPRTANTQ